VTESKNENHGRQSWWKGWLGVEAAILFLLGLSVFLSKPGIYTFSVALVFYAVTRTFMDPSYRNEFSKVKYKKIVLGLFLLALLSALVATAKIEDIAWAFRKTFFLLLIPPLFLAFRLERARLIGLAGTLLGSWIAVAITVHNNWGLFDRARISGTWMAGPWDALLGMHCLFLFFLALSCKQKPVVKSFFFLNLCIFAVFLLLAGGRAPWLAAAFCTLSYLIFFQRQLLFKSALVLTSMLLVAWLFFPDRTEQSYERLSSSSNLSEVSNWTRLQLWDLTLQHLTFYAQNEPIKLLFGAGAESYANEQKEFFQHADFTAANREKLEQYGYPTGDPHNSYLDAVAKFGALWTLGLIAYLSLLARTATYSGSKARPEIGFFLLNFLIVGFFYSIAPSFSMFFLIWFLMILAGVLDTPAPQTKVPQILQT
jgi:hypothetical protein